MPRSGSSVSSGFYEAVVIGVSAGGLHALNAIFTHLPEGFGISIIVVQHIHPHADTGLVDLLNKRHTLRIKEADEKESIAPGTVYFAPANYHLLVEEDRTFSLSVEERVNYSRPSLDLLFETAADVYGERLIGIVLTGANRDGSAGLKRIKERGGLAVVQDPETAEASLMPQSALETVPVDYTMPLEEIGPWLVAVARNRSLTDSGSDSESPS